MKLLLSFKACQASKLFYVWIHQNLDQCRAEIYHLHILNLVYLYYINRKYHLCIYICFGYIMTMHHYFYDSYFLHILVISTSVTHGYRRW